MKLLYQFGVIMTVTFLGEILHGLIPLPMLAALCTGVVRLEKVKIAGDFLLEIMPPMFIPAAVGLLTAWADLKAILVPVLVITAVTTVLVMAVTGRTAQTVIRKGKGGRDHE